MTMHPFHAAIPESVQSSFYQFVESMLLLNRSHLRYSFHQSENLVGSVHVRIGYWDERQLDGLEYKELV